MPVFRRTKRWLLLLSGLLLSSILLAACGENSPSILQTAGPVAQSESMVFWAILVISVIIFVVVEGWLIIAIVRYRSRPGLPNPRQIHGNMTAEITWTVIPTVVLFIVLVFTIRGLIDVAPESQPADSNTVNVTVVGHQWWWEFYYPKYNITTADTLHIPENTVIHVDLYSNNVIHSFWVPQLTGKTDVVPGHANTKWFKADHASDTPYEGFCTEYCGMQHANMKFDVKVDTSDQFMTWVSAQQQAAAAPASGSLAEQGAKIFQQQCTSCHGIVGVDLTSIQNPATTCDSPTKACLVGPNLTHFGSRHLIAGGVLEYNTASCDPTDPNLLQKCALAQWLHDPQGEKPGNDMAIGQLSNQQISQLVAYLEGLK